MLVAASSSCLVTSSPDFSPPESTHPEILTNDEFPPSPSPGELTLFYPTAGEYSPAEFSAFVRSDHSDRDVQTVLLIDYGEDTGTSSGPYRLAIPGEPLKSAELAKGPQLAAIPWRPQKQEPAGCHTVTLLVTHKFKQILDPPQYYCPEDPQDASSLTWMVAVCETENPEECDYTNCPARGEPATYCGDVSAEPDGGTTP